MQGTEIKDAAIVGVLVLMTLKVVFDFIRAKPSNGNGNSMVSIKWKMDEAWKLLSHDIGPQTKAIHDLLQAKDGDGIPAYYNSPLMRIMGEMSQTIDGLSRKIEEQEALIRKLGVLRHGKDI